MEPSSNQSAGVMFLAYQMHIIEKRQNFVGRNILGNIGFPDVFCKDEGEFAARYFFVLLNEVQQFFGIWASRPVSD